MIDTGTATNNRPRVCMAYFHRPNTTKKQTVPPASMDSRQPFSACPRMNAVAATAVHGMASKPNPLDPPRRMLMKTLMSSFMPLATARVTWEKPRSSRMNSNVALNQTSTGMSSVWTASRRRLSMLLSSECAGRRSKKSGTTSRYLPKTMAPNSASTITNALVRWSGRGPDKNSSFISFASDPGRHSEGVSRNRILRTVSRCSIPTVSPRSSTTGTGRSCPRMYSATS